MFYLYSVSEYLPVWALQTQEMLWQSYLTNQSGIGSGISAMPSVHVAVAFLFLLMSRGYTKWARRFFVVFFIFILLGSVHLGWHYAVDGYLAMIVTGVIWFLSGRLIKNRAHHG